MRETRLYEAKLKADGQLLTDAVKRERKQTAANEKAAKAEAKAKAKAQARSRPPAPSTTPAPAASSSQGMPMPIPTAPPQPKAPPAQGRARDPFAGRTERTPSPMEVGPTTESALAPTPKRLEPTLAEQVAQTAKDEVRAEAHAAICEVTQRAEMELMQVDNRRAAAETMAIRQAEEAQHLRAQVLALQQQQLLGQPSAAETCALATASGSTVESYELTVTEEHDNPDETVPTTISMSPSMAAACSVALPATPVNVQLQDQMQRTILSAGKGKGEPSRSDSSIKQLL